MGNSDTLNCLNNKLAIGTFVSYIIKACGNSPWITTLIL